ncbi:MAG: acylphosphatase, partial [Elusimicrobiota bacterium]
MKIFRIKISGLVQGVGFRPFVYRIATNLGINGTIENRTDGVVIEINGDDLVVKTFVDNIKQQAPPASAIDLVQIEMIDKYICFENFKIVKSTNISNAVTEISPDIAVCNDCLNDMKLQAHRIAYPFINCTNCGPRFSIIQNLP